MHNIPCSTRILRRYFLENEENIFYKQFAMNNTTSFPLIQYVSIVQINREIIAFGDKQTSWLYFYQMNQNR